MAETMSMDNAAEMTDMNLTERWAKMSQSQKNWVGGTVVLGGAAYITATTFLGIYTFNNPDPENCWVVKDLEYPDLTQAAVIKEANDNDVDVADGYPVNMANVFRGWFAWGFWAHIAFVAFMMIGMAIYQCSTKASRIWGGITWGLSFGNYVSWIILGSIWRFTKPGQIASGDKLIKDDGVDDATWKAQKERALFEKGY